MEPTPSDFSDDRRARREPLHRHAASPWLDDLEATLSDTSHTDLEALKRRLSEQIKAARNALGDSAETAGDMMSEALDCAEDYVRVRPWQALGVTAAAAFILGVAMGRR